MPNLTPNLGLKKPLGTEFVTRAAYSENLDILDENAAKAEGLIALEDTIADLAGEGRTTETLKGNADDLAAHLADYVSHGNYAIDAGAANAYVISIPGFTAYGAGKKKVFRAQNTNTGTSTINVNGLGTRAIRAINGDILPAQAINSGQIVTLVDNGTYFAMVSVPFALNGILNHSVVNVTNGNGVGLFNNSNKMILLYAVDKTTPANYLFAIGWKGTVNVDTHVLRLIANNVLTLGSANSSGTQVISGGTASNIVAYGIMVS